MANKLTTLILCILALAHAHVYAGKVERRCSSEISPVCGTDGAVYANMCYFSEAQELDPALAIGSFEIDCDESKRRGVVVTCPIESPSLRKDCPKGCTMQYDPVCGSDNVTYGNACTLELAACVDTSIRFLHKGECKNSTDLRENILDLGLDDCEKPCAKIYGPVCGSDGVTYPNRCSFEIANCRDPRISLVKDGPCESEQTALVLIVPPSWTQDQNGSEPAGKEKRKSVESFFKNMFAKVKSIFSRN